MFTLALLVVIAAGIWSGWVFLHPAASSDDRHTAQTIAIAIIAACVGYLVKR